MSKTAYQEKDRVKFFICNKLISRGVVSSSSYQYSMVGIGDIKPEMVNCGKYEKEDVVGISVNGNRRQRLMADWNEIKRAINANVTFVTDADSDRNRPYNVGEREVATFLIKNGYMPSSTAKACIWGKVL